MCYRNKKLNEPEFNLYDFLGVIVVCTLILPPVILYILAKIFEFFKYVFENIVLLIN